MNLIKIFSELLEQKDGSISDLLIPNGHFFLLVAKILISASGEALDPANHKTNQLMIC